MMNDRWYERKMAVVMCGSPSKREHAADKMTAKYLACQAIFCPQCETCADQKRMAWLENDSTQLIIPGSVHCLKCLPTTIAKLYTLAREKLKNEGGVISVHCPNRTRQKGLNKLWLQDPPAPKPPTKKQLAREALLAEKDVYLVVVEHVLYSPERILACFSGKESLGKKFTKTIATSNCRVEEFPDRDSWESYKARLKG